MKEYPAYLKVCSLAIKDDTVFKKFRKIQPYHNVVEGVPGNLGMDYLLWVKENEPDILRYISKFATNDTVGSPTVYPYGGLEAPMSSTTCRYIKVLAELVHIFGSLKDLDIIEIGGGYGGQCKIICEYEKPKSYTIVDLPEASALAEKYLRYFGIDYVLCKTAATYHKKGYSLCISNYAFSEFDRRYQEFYAEHIINYAKQGYMLCNFFGENVVPGREDCFTKEEIFNLKPMGRILPEEPATTEGNFLYVW